MTCTIQGNADGSTAVDYTVNCATGYPALTGGATPGATSARPMVSAVCGRWRLELLPM